MRGGGDSRGVCCLIRSHLYDMVDQAWSDLMARGMSTVRH